MTGVGVAAAGLGLAGAVAIRRMSRAGSGGARVPDPSPGGEVPRAGRAGESGSTLGTLSSILGNLERLASDLDGLALRLHHTQRELRSASAQLQEFSFRDEVTRTYNRRFFSIRLEEEVSRHRRFGHPVAVALLDVDNFKSINDELGHAAGDATLREVAEVLRQQSRGINVICRYGGDEFAVLLVETDATGARVYADRLRAALAEFPFAHRRRVTFSVGIAALPLDAALTADDLVRVADDALYTAKRAGKDRVVAAQPADRDRARLPAWEKA
ncbi:MAG TPA: GGDEF domain-containing protein [Candidatus Binatia bacterium]|nr:GGDEF domain-containing protein [Candidatus Binatia bacterium]